MNAKKLIITVLLWMPVILSAQKANDFFVGINPIAPFTSIPNQYTNLYLPLISNLETGIALNAGLIKDKSTYEIRYSVGKPNKLYILYQVHIGYNHFISPQQRMYIGGFIKYYSNHNTLNNVKNKSIIPYLTAGYIFRFKKYFIDFRLNQNIYAISWSNQENTKVNADFHYSIFKEMSPIIPYLSVNIGYFPLKNKSVK